MSGGNVISIIPVPFLHLKAGDIIRFDSKGLKIAYSAEKGLGSYGDNHPRLEQTYLVRRCYRGRISSSNVYLYDVDAISFWDRPLPRDMALSPTFTYEWRDSLSASIAEVRRMGNCFGENDRNQILDLVQTIFKMNPKNGKIKEITMDDIYVYVTTGKELCLRLNANVLYDKPGIDYRPRTGLPPSYTVPALMRAPQ